MRTVYAVTSGEYSDYIVHCLFESEADADAYIAKCQAVLVEQEKNVWGDDVPPGNFVYFTEPFQLWDAVPSAVIDGDGYGRRSVRAE